MSTIAIQTGLDQFIDGVRNLPPSPSLMIELLGLLKKPDRDIDQLVGLMSHDPSLTAEILRRCNSAYFGNDQPATDMFEATFRLGFHEVYRIATALFGARLLKIAPSASSARQLDVIWEHSAMTAVSAGLLAKELGESEGMAFTAGLLHDVGKVVLLCANAGDEGLATGVPLLTDLSEGEEKKQFGFDHCEVGGRLLARWAFPSTIFTPVLHHHYPSQGTPFEPFAAVLCLADWLAQTFTEGGQPARVEGEALEFSMEILEMNSDRLDSIRSRAREDIQRAKRLFNVQK